MSWLTDLASKAENFLNTLDSSAAEVLKSSSSVHPDQDIPKFDYMHSSNNEPTIQSTRCRYDLPHVVRTFESKESDFIVPSDRIDRISDYSARPVQTVVKTNDNSFKKIESTKLKPISEPDLFEFLNSPTPSHDPISIKLGTNAKSEYLIDPPREDTSSSGYETLVSMNDMNPEAIGPSGTVPKEPTRAEYQQEQNSHQIISDLGASSKSDTGSRLNSQLISDLRLENKLLRSEVSSMNQEISDLLRRNHMALEESKQYKGQVERLTNQLRDTNSEVRELKSKLSSTSMIQNQSGDSALQTKLERTLAELTSNQAELCSIKAQLETTRQSVAMLTATVREAQEQMQISEKRATLAQKEHARISSELVQYKEKANRILSDKEQIIASLTARNTHVDHHDGSPTSATDEDDLNSDAKVIASLRVECDFLREEASRWRIEVENREMAMQELEMQMQSERASLRRNLQLLERQAECEKQLRESADSDLAQVRQQLRELKESFNQERDQFQSQNVANEAAISSLKEILTRRQMSSSSSLSPELSNRSTGLDQWGSPGSPHSDPTESAYTLDSHIKQLKESLLTKQDALDAVLAQNHALKIRLDRIQSENEMLNAALSADESRIEFDNGRLVGLGCTRLNLNNSAVPRILRKPAYRLDAFGIRIANTLRRCPSIRLLLLIYLATLHFWLMLTCFWGISGKSA